MTEAPTSAAAAAADSALGRITALVRAGATPADVFAVVTDELARAVGADAASLLRFDANDSVSVLSTRGRQLVPLPTGRRSVTEALRELRANGRATRGGPAGSEDEVIGVPIVLRGRVWGAALAGTSAPGGLADGAHLVMTALLESLTVPLALAEANATVARLAGEQSALRRLAALAASGAAPHVVFGAVAAEAAAQLDGTHTEMARFEEDSPGFVVVATSGDEQQVGKRFAIGDGGIAARIRRSRGPERIDDYSRLPGMASVSGMGVRAAVGAPVTVGDELWGVLGARSTVGPLPPDTERRLEQFAEIAAALISISQTQEAQRRLGREQAALLRVAGLVTRGAAERELFDAVTTEAVGLIDNENATLIRYEGARTFTIVSTCCGPAPVGTVVDVPPEDEGVMAQTLQTLAPARRDDYRDPSANLFSREMYGVGSSVAVPILVDGQLWGMLGSLTTGRRLPNDTEARLQKFTELIGAALANNQARNRLKKLADDQAALRDVAELVARGALLDEVFDTIAVTASALMGGLPTALMRYDDDGIATIVAAHDIPASVGTRLASDGDTLTGEVLRTGRPSRVAGYAGSRLEDGDREPCTAVGVGVPVIVEGRTWGVMSTSADDLAPPAWAEDRLQEVAGLAAAAIAGAENKAGLKASRARVLATADEARRRLQRDVHDGAQQRLVQTVITLKLSRDANAHGAPITELIDQALYHAERANAELRDLLHGVLPAPLSRGGLRAGIQAMLIDLPLRVDFRSDVARLPEDIETTAYFIVAEAMANVVKHACAQQARIDVSVKAGTLRIEVSDNGVGGADFAKGTGLTGLSDRVAAADGTLSIVSQRGEGTLLRATLPLVARAGDRAPDG